MENWFIDKAIREYHAYYWEPDAFSEEEIQSIESQIIDKGLLLEKGQTFSSSGASPARDSKICWLNKEDFSSVYEKAFAIAELANDKMWKLDLLGAREMIQYSHYEGGGGHYTWHVDVGKEKTYACRKISIIIQLSDPSEYEGGDLELMLDTPDPLKAYKKKGGAILFPSFIPHRVLPVESGLRKSLVLWISGPPFK